MGRFVKGDIVALNFPFSNFSEAKRCPALVLSDLEGGDIILCQITSKSKTDKYSIRLGMDDSPHKKPMKLYGLLLTS